MNRSTKFSLIFTRVRPGRPPLQPPNVNSSDIMSDNSDLNLGCVIYTETSKGLIAEWVFRKKNSVARGEGFGIRFTEINPDRRFEGKFEITYLDSLGNHSPKLHLTISFREGIYHLVWRDHEKKTDEGIGIEKNNQLVASYTAAI